MLFLYTLFTIAMLGLLAAGIFEQRQHLRNLHSIPTRIMINGIRGKSSITRLCAGATRGSMRTIAKTTGSAARFIWPDGSEVPVYRKFDIANVVEQIGVIRTAASERADVLVMECMAVDPTLQELNQNKLVRSTIGVISNVREDHLTEMGPTLSHVARSLSRSMPIGGVCITAERDWYPILAEEARKRDCRLVTVDPASVTDEEMDGFGYFAFKENVAIALAVAEELGISRGEALDGMWLAEPDPGVLTVRRYSVGDDSIRFANVFAANDPASTIMNFEQLLDGGDIQPPIYALINCRPDRVERNRQMSQILPDIQAEKVFMVGYPTKSAVSAVPRTWNGEVIELGGLNRTGDDIFRRVMHEVDGEASVLAIGNIHGQGELLLEHLETLRELI